MRIVFLRDKIRVDEGGASWSLHLLAQRLSERGHEVEVVTVHHSRLGNELPEEPLYELTERPLENYTQIDGAYRVYRILDEIERPDVLHSFQPQLHPIVAAWKKRNPDVPIVGRLNTYQNFCTNVANIDDGCYEDCTLRRKWKHHPDPSIGGIPKMAFDTFVQPRMLNRFDRFHAQSPAVKEIFSGFGIHDELLKVVPNFYDRQIGDPFHHDCLDTDCSNDDYRAIFVGRLQPEKGLDILLDAVDDVSVDITLDVLGDGTEFDRLNREASENVTFHGWVDHHELAKFFTRADVLVHPGLWPDPCPRSVIEAMQFCCIPIVSDTGGPPWMVGSAGRTFPSGEGVALAHHLQELHETTKRPDHLQSLESELERFTPEIILDQIEQTYSEIVS